MICDHETIPNLSSNFEKFMFLKKFWTLIALALFAGSNSLAIGEVRVTTTRADELSSHDSRKIPLPAIDDAASKAVGVSISRGSKDPNGAGFQVLFDGRLPSSDDAPGENYFFAPGSDGGCIAIDLGKVLPISEVATYSWHSQERAPQVYTLYGAEKEFDSFRWESLPDKVSPTQWGWKTIAKVNTQSKKDSGGFHASLIDDDKEGTLGNYRYLLFEIEPSDKSTPFGQTFFSEIDVLVKGAEAPQRILLPESQLIEFKSADEKYSFVIDTTAAPSLHDWTAEELQPIVAEWYPRIVEMLPSKDFEALRQVRLRYLPSEQMGAIPAYAQGGTISMNAGWFAREKEREARGAVVHELVHVVQSYPSRSPRTGPPGWIVEGIPDYIRWFLYEPQSKGALLSPAALANAKHDASYRVSANFIDWAIQNYGAKGDFLQRLNATAREGRYTSSVWKDLTGKTEEELSREWKNQ